MNRLHSSELGTEGSLGIVERIDNSTTQITERYIKVAHKWILFTGVSYKIVALQEFFIVGGNLRLYSRITDTTTGRQQLLGMCGIGDIVTHIAYHVELVVQVLALLIGGTLLTHRLGSHCLNTGHGKRTLITSNVFIDITQLIFNDGQTLLDKLIGGHTDLVAVLHPVFIIDIDNGL